MGKLKKLLVTSLCTALVGACLVPVTSAVVKALGEETWSDVTINEEYLVDETLNVPGRTLTVGGETYEATVKMTYPDGKTKIVQSGDMVLETAGEYTITYEARANGKRYSETEEFFVANKLWSVKNEKSSVEYGKVGSTDALLVCLAKGDALTFNKIVDLTDYNAKDELIKGFINPTAVGSNDFEKLIFTFTDVYDPEQVLTVRANKSGSSVHTSCGSYWTAAGSNQTLGGWDDNAKRFSVKTTTEDRICGTYRGVSFCSISGKYNSSTGLFDQTEVSADVEVFGVHFNQSTKELSVSDKSGAKMVTDLDNPEYYESEPLWGGFTSGKVIVSVTADDYASETANFAISKLFGYDLSAENRFVETDAPIITVNAEDKYVNYDAKLNRYSFSPLAVVGGNYPVPTATAFDGYSGDVEVTVKAYFDYANSKQSKTIKNNTFAVDAKGSYAIVYTAKDYMGNVAERIYWVTAVDALDDPLTLTVNKADAEVESFCGEKIEVATAQTTGGSGDANITVTATCGDTVLEVSEGVFIAEKAGTWTVKYQAVDYAGITVEDSYEITVTVGDAPVFVDAPVFPKYFISGMEYNVPTVYAYDYSSGTKVEKIASLEVKDANGTKTYEAGEAYTPVADENGEIGLTFVCESASMPMEVNVVAPRTGSLGIEIEKMIVGNGVNVTRDKDGLTMEAAVDGSFDWTFANALAAENVALYVKGVKNYSAFGGMKVTLTDYANSSIAVTMFVEHNENGVLRVKFGDADRELTKGLNLGVDSNGRALNELSFSYKAGKFYVDNLGVNVTTDDNGKPFNGFPSGKVYISSEAFDVKVGEKYLVTQIDNHIIGVRSRDSATPRIAINGWYGGMYDVNSEYVLGTALASDVIDPNLTCTVSVVTPNGAVMKDVNGVELKGVSADKEYVLKLTEYGQYLVTYTSTDWAGQEGKATYAINIFDRKAPRAYIKGEWSDTAKVGDTVVLPEIEVSDDFSAKNEISVYRTVRNPYDVLTTVGYDIANVKYRFTFKYAGKYKFVIIVTDAAGNETMIDYVVTVS